jgi:hypothetical protein
MLACSQSTSSVVDSSPCGGYAVDALDQLLQLAVTADIRRAARDRSETYQEVLDVRVAEWGAVHLVDRFRAAQRSRKRLRLTLADHRAVIGSCIGVGDELVLMDCGSGGLMAMRLGYVQWIDGLPTSLGEDVQRTLQITWTQTLRSIAGRARFTLASGDVILGGIHAVAADHVEIVQAEGPRMSLPTRGVMSVNLIPVPLRE